MKTHFFVLFFAFWGILFLVPQMGYAQSEEDILNSIGNELELESEKEKEKERIEKEYNSLKSKADAAYSSKNYDKAKEYYTEMLKLDPESDYSKNRIALIDQKQKEAERLANQKAYDELISQADGLLTAEKWDDAKAKYQAAAKIFPEEAYPKTQLSKIGKLQAESQAAAAAAEIQKKYDNYKSQGDAAMGAQKWDDAVKFYTLASNAKPDETYPKQQIQKVEQLKKDAEEQAAQAALDKKYSALTQAGDAALAAKNWDVAKEKYKLAMEAKPNEAYARDQYAKVDQLKAQEIEREEQAKLEAEYKKQIQTADQLFNSQKWPESVEAYQQAKKLKPEESYPTTQITKAQSKIQEEKDAAQKMAQIESDYQREKNKGEEAVAKEDWVAAIEAFTSARALKPNNNDIIQLLDQAKVGKRSADELALKQKAEKEAKEKMQNQFNNELAIGNQAISDKNWKAAREAFLRAQKLDPENVVPNEKLAEVNNLEEQEQLAFAAQKKAEEEEKANKAEMERLAAEKAKAEEAERLAKEKAELENSKAQFAAAVDAFYSAVSQNNWDEAEQAITTAKSRFPENEKIGQMTKELEQQRTAFNRNLEKQQAEEQKQAELQKQYDQFVKSGDQNLADGNLAEAEKSFGEALKVKPKEEYPVSKLAEIQEMKLAQNKAELEKQKELHDQYSSLMAKGGSAMEIKDWEQARKFFEEAQKLKPENQGPGERIAEMEKQIAREKEIQKQQAELDAEYAKNMEKGQKSLDNKDYAEAKKYFMGAFKLKPGETLPKEKLAETERLWAIYLDSQKEADAQRQRELKDKEFNGYMEKANRAFEAEEWDQAILGYQNALKVKPDDELAQSQLVVAKENKEKALAEVMQRQKEEQARLAELEKERLRKEQDEAELLAKQDAFANYLKTADEAFQEEQYKKAVQGYEKALELEPENQEVQQKLGVALAKYRESEAKRQAAEAERQRQAEIEMKKRQAAALKEQEEYLAKIKMYSPEELAKRYPDGITEEEERVESTVITKSIIVENGEGRFLLRFTYPWGDEFYYIDGRKVRADAYYWDIRKYKF